MARGKRGRYTAAAFEYNLADHLLELQEELLDKSHQPGVCHSFYIHEPKRRLISAAPFRDRPDVRATFPDSEAVNRTLRGWIDLVPQHTRPIK